MHDPSPMRTVTRAATGLTVLGALALLAGCVHTKYTPLDGYYPARPADCDVQVFTSGPPRRDYHEIGLVEGSGELWKADLQDILPKIREEACLAGGDAIVLLSSDRIVVPDYDGATEELHAVATVIRWGEG